MRMKYKGYTVDFNVKKFMESSMHDKSEVLGILIRDNFNYYKQRWHDYWIGYVDVYEENISEFTEDETMVTKIESVSVIVGRKGDGQSFHNLTRPICEQLVKDWKSNTKKRYRLHLDLGGSIYQDYVFTRRQKDMLISKLEPILRSEWYDAD